MHRSLVRPLVRTTSILLAAATAAAAPLAAQRSRAASPKPTVLDVTPYAGFARFGTLLDGPLGTSLRSAGSALYGAQAGLALSEHVSVVGNVAYASSDLEIGLPIIGGLDVGTTRHLVYDVGVEGRLPLAGASRTITPFAQGGVGAIETRLQNVLLRTKDTNLAFNGGAGVDLALGSGLGVRAMVKDYVGRFDASGSTGVGVRGDWTHNVAGSVGVRLSF